MDQFLDRTVKLRVELTGTAGYRHSSGFVVGPDTVLTVAHAIENAVTVTLSGATGSETTQEIEHLEVRAGDPDGRSGGGSPDLALLTFRGSFPDVDPCPIALLDRDAVRSDDGFLDGRVTGWPMSALVSASGVDGDTESPLRDLFDREARLSLLSGAATGRMVAEVGTSVTGDWDGISGAPVFVGGLLVGVVTEHHPQSGAQSLTMTPLVDLERDDRHLERGTGMSDSATWWALLGVERLADLPKLPPPDARSDLLRRLGRLHDAVRSTSTKDHDPLVALPQLIEMLDEAATDRPASSCRAMSLSPSAEHEDEPLRYSATLAHPVRPAALTCVLDHFDVVSRQSPGADVIFEVLSPLSDGDTLREAARDWIAARIDPEDAAAFVARIRLADRDPLGDLVSGLGTIDCSSSIRSAVDHLLAWDGRKPSACLVAIRTLVAGTPSTKEIVLGPGDRAPDTIERRDGGVLTNAQPMLRDLRDGYFAEAVDLDAMELAFFEWQANRDRVDGGASGAGVFLITGPSGSGKSIAMLQLLARLRDRGGMTTVLSTGKGPPGRKSLSSAVELGLHRNVVIGIDDPQAFGARAPGQNWARFAEPLTQQRHIGRADQFPTLIACAWPAAKRSLPPEVSVYEYRIDPRDRAYLERLSRWYRFRTGNNTIPDPDGTKLPAQLFEEWNSGHGVREAAERFRDRLSDDGHDVADLFDELLALNRLSISMPEHMMDRLEPTVVDALATYREDGHLGTRGNHSSEQWFQHPHLADLYYDVWWPAHANRAVRRRHLSRALDLSIRSAPDGQATIGILDQCLATLDALPGERSTGQEDRDALVDALRHVGKPAAHGDGLRALARWLDVEERCGPFETWSPLDVLKAAMEDLKATVENETDDPVGLTAALGSLASLGTEADVELVGLLVSRIRDPSDRLEVLGRVAARPGHVVIPEVILEAIRTALPSAPGVEAFITLLQYHPTFGLGLLDEVLAGEHGRGRWVGAVAAAAVTSHPDAETRVLNWLGAAVRPENSLVLAVYLRRPRLPLFVSTPLKRWLLALPDRARSAVRSSSRTASDDAVAELGFAHVLAWTWCDARVQRSLERLLRTRDVDSTSPLATKLAEMLEGSSDAWSWLFQLLPVSMMRQVRIDAAARGWLRRHMDSPAWSGVYGALCAASDVPDQTLVAIGLAWKAHAHAGRDADKVSRVLRGALLRARSDGVDELRQDALTWAGANLDHEGTGLVLPALIGSADGDDVVGTALLARTWLERHPGSRGSSYVIRSLLRAALGPAERAALLRLVRDWIQHTDHPGWSFVYLDVRHELDQELRLQLTARWVPVHVEDPRWSAVLSSDRDTFSSSELRSLFIDWLRNRTVVDDSIGFLWRHLVEEGPLGDDASLEELADAVFERLERSGRQPSWWFMWVLYVHRPTTRGRSLTVALQGDLDVQRQHGVGKTIGQLLRDDPNGAGGLWDLVDAAPRNDVWNRVFLAMTIEDPSERAWEIGFQRLAEVPDDRYSSWWRRLWKMRDELSRRLQLRAVGEQWLRSAPAETPGAVKVRERLEEFAATRDTPGSIARRINRP